MKRAVPDTHILISAFLFGGLPNTFVAMASMRAFYPIISAALLDELEDVLRRKFARPEVEIAAIRSKLEAMFDIVSPSVTLHVVKDDPDDDRVLECAVAGRAHYIVTGDRHLLKMREYDGIEIVTLRQFMDLLIPPA